MEAAAVEEAEAAVEVGPHTLALSAQSAREAEAAVEAEEEAEEEPRIPVLPAQPEREEEVAVVVAVAVAEEGEAILVCYEHQVARSIRRHIQLHTRAGALVPAQLPLLQFPKPRLGLLLELTDSYLELKEVVVAVDWHGLHMQRQQRHRQRRLHQRSPQQRQSSSAYFV